MAAWLEDGFMASDGRRTAAVALWVCSVPASWTEGDADCWLCDELDRPLGNVFEVDSDLSAGVLGAADAESTRRETLLPGEYARLCVRLRATLDGVCERCNFAPCSNN